ncbi:MAG TPA: hypothetical protein VHC94_01735 [Nitrobacter sp.]|nr:hypothetical protein [Nitrobacter sp.]
MSTQINGTNLYVLSDDQLDAVSGGRMHLPSTGPNPQQDGTTAGAGNSFSQLVGGTVLEVMLGAAIIAI